MKNSSYSFTLEISLLVFVVPGRLELPTSTLSVWRSNQLSYRTSLVREWTFSAQFPFSLLYLKTEFVSTRRFLEKLPYLFFYYYTCFRLYFRCTFRKGISRKEVFQPHLPVRLPCYDLAPITSFALGRPLRSRTSSAPGFHGLTGGVYKARERIHRAMADARLLANPASRSRVADSDPN